MKNTLPLHPDFTYEFTFNNGDVIQASGADMIEAMKRKGIFERMSELHHYDEVS